GCHIKMPAQWVCNFLDSLLYIKGTLKRSLAYMEFLGGKNGSKKPYMPNFRPFYLCQNQGDLAILAGIRHIKTTGTLPVRDTD
ncbi:MAG: hypothetical protein QME16_06780, partial [Planctomycetota bacterium]|nr:hypothetical protein [Planctomycetota bacterium]